jgi:hypothetical protein
MRVERDVCGIQGLHIMFDAFPEDVERGLFTSQEIHNDGGRYVKGQGTGKSFWSMTADGGRAQQMLLATSQVAI